VHCRESTNPFRRRCAKALPASHLNRNLNRVGVKMQDETGTAKEVGQVNSAIVGIGWHMLGAACPASFYSPIGKVRKWSWETTWAVAGIFSWILLPVCVSLGLLPDFRGFTVHLTRACSRILVVPPSDLGYVLIEEPIAGHVTANESWPESLRRGRSPSSNSISDELSPLRWISFHVEIP
jgi:hypothetical protein